MKALAFVSMLALVLAVSACGNYSNDDIAFLDALPSKAQLDSNLASAPASAKTSGSGVSASEAPGMWSALAVGQTAELATDTRGASEAFNAGIFLVLDLLQQVTALPPSERKPNERVWGPYPAAGHAGWVDELVMTRDGADFTYQGRVRRSGTEAWTTVLTGAFHATGGIRKGEGDVHLDVPALISSGFDPTASADVSSVDLSYQTAVSPITVDLVLAQVGSNVPLAAYSYEGADDGSGGMRFSVQIGSSTLDVRSEWLSSGAGRADAEYLAGSYVGATYTQCWDVSDGILYSSQSWAPPPVGDASNCPIPPPQ